MRKAITIPILVGAGVVAAAPRLFRRAWRPPLRVVEKSPRDLGLPEEQMWLDGDSGLKLHGWFVPVEGAADAVVVLHGWGGNASLMLDLAPYIHEAGMHAFFLDARNHGFSDHDGFVSMLKFADDLGVAIDFLRDREDVGHVGVIGHSVGAAAAIYRASHHDDADAVVAVASFSHPGEIMDQSLSLPNPFRRLMLMAVESTIGAKFDAIAPRSRISEVSVPIMLVHGEDDDVVPPENTRELAEKNPGAEVLFVPEGGHSSLEPFEPYFPEVMGFIKRAFSE